METINFAEDVQLVCLGTFALLLLYTLWLSRYRGLDAHMTVRWALVQCAALFAVGLWRWLPIFGFTSRLQDRQLLLLTMVLFFAFVTFLMLDILVRISKQTGQLKKLTQELAIQRLRVDGIIPAEGPSQPADAGVSLTSGVQPDARR
jgi:hypothetical protein